MTQGDWGVAKYADHDKLVSRSQTLYPTAFLGLQLGFSGAPFVTQAINKSIEELGFQNAATPDQVKVVKFVSGLYSCPCPLEVAKVSALPLFLWYLIT